MNRESAADAHVHPKRLLIYAHFDPRNAIRDYVVHALRSMLSQCTEIRFVTTSKLPQVELEKIQSLVSETLEVENVGLDFHMWKLCLQSAPVADYDELVLMNSSVYGPLSDISAVFEKMRNVECDFWGITENFEYERHLQSYFLVFRKAVLTSDAFGSFWGSVLPYKSKRQIVRSYEIGLSHWLLDNGFRPAPFCGWEQLVAFLRTLSAGKSLVLKKRKSNAYVMYKKAGRSIARFRGKEKIHHIDPSIAYPAELIRYGVPFLKVSVLRDNQYHRNISEIKKLLKLHNYPENLI